VGRTIEDVHDRLRTEVAARADAVWEVAARLHADPEYAFAEHRAAAARPSRRRPGCSTRWTRR
jgi:hypothetical protein